MDIDLHFKNRLTKEEKLFFFKNGYLIVKDAIDKALITALNQECDKLLKPSDHGFINDADMISKGGAYLNLTTLPTILPKLTGLLGWNIWINHSHTNVHPPSNCNNLKDFEYGWHRDGGMIEEDLINDTIPCFSIKVGFFLTSTEKKDSGTTLCIPRSHITKQPLPDEYSVPADAVPISVPAGSALLMNPRIIHSVRSPNCLSRSRKTIFIQWAYRWLHPVDANTTEKLKSTITNKYQMQLLGLSTNPRALKEKYAIGRSGWYYPNDDEVPLKEYVKKLYRTTDKTNFVLAD